MYELVIIMLVGAACDMQPFYQEEMPDAIVACSDFDTLHGTMAHWNGFALVSDYNVVYVVNEWDEMPDFYDEKHKLAVGGVAYPESNYAIAYRYPWVILHELGHLICECDHGPVHDLAVNLLNSR